MTIQSRSGPARSRPGFLSHQRPARWGVLLALVTTVLAFHYWSPGTGGVVPPPPAPSATAVAVQVHFTQPLALPGLTEGAVVAAIENALDAEFLSESIDFAATVTTTNYVSAARSAVAQIEISSGYEEARQTLGALLDDPGTEIDYQDPANASPEFQAALQEYLDAEAAMESQLAASANLAGLAAGSVGYVFTPAESYGGATFRQEKFSKIRTGLVALIFPAPAVLQSGSSAIDIDFTDTAFDPYRSAYDDAARTAYMRRHVVNNAMRELGHQFGLADNGGALNDAMRGSVNVQEAEHFVRDAAIAQFNATDRAALATALRAWAGGMLAQGAVRR